MVLLDYEGATTQVHYSFILANNFSLREAIFKKNIARGTTDPKIGSVT